MLRNWIADEQTQWDYGEPFYPTADAVRELLDTKYIASYSRDDYYRWAVIEKSSDECIGQIAFFKVDSNNRHSEIDCRTVNEASRRVIEKCGLTYEGTFRDFFWRKDHFEGRRVYSILKSEYEAAK